VKEEFVRLENAHGQWNMKKNIYQGRKTNDGFDTKDEVPNGMKYTNLKKPE